MIDKRIKLDCPFCGHKKEDIQIKVMGQYHEIYCPKCEVKFTGTSKEEIINKWNCRV